MECGRPMTALWDLLCCSEEPEEESTARGGSVQASNTRKPAIRAPAAKPTATIPLRTQPAAIKPLAPKQVILPTTKHLSSKSAAITVKNTTIPNLYAVVIGINNYPKHPHLTGAVADADLINEFLRTDLGVPDFQITNLRNSSASRAEIIRAFQTLRDNPRIQRGSPILIFFARHGGQTDASEEWRRRYGTVNKIQAIHPYDSGVQVAGKPVHCIPDTTIAKLLNEIAAAKGDNITVIFDSCHSASGTRTASDRMARSAEVKFAIPADIDDEILLPSSISNSANSDLSAAPVSPSSGQNRQVNLPLYTHQSSHIHLAACGSNEKALEHNGRGDFTTALVETIRAFGVDKMSYDHLTKALPRLPKAQNAHNTFSVSTHAESIVSKRELYEWNRLNEAHIFVYMEF